MTNIIERCLTEWNQFIDVVKPYFPSFVWSCILVVIVLETYSFIMCKIAEMRKNEMHRPPSTTENTTSKADIPTDNQTQQSSSNQQEQPNT